MHSAYLVLRCDKFGGVIAFREVTELKYRDIIITLCIRLVYLLSWQEFLRANPLGGRASRLRKSLSIGCACARSLRSKRVDNPSHSRQIWKPHGAACSRAAAGKPDRHPYPLPHNASPSAPSDAEFISPSLSHRFITFIVKLQLRLRNYYEL